MFELPRLEDFYPFLSRFAGGVARSLVILLIAWLATRMIKRLVAGLRSTFVRMMLKHATGPDVEMEKRAATIGGIIRKSAGAIIWSVAFIMVLDQAGYDITPVLAGAGVLGLAIGFGAQHLVRDVITGLFMLIENQVRVNDAAIINGTGGLVEEINLRTTTLRSLDGVVHIFPNGSIKSLSNMTREFSYYVFNLGVAYKEDTDRVIAAVKEVADQLMEEEPYQEVILAPIEFLGVDSFGDSAVYIKARFKTKPIKQWMVGREMNRRIKKKFDEVGIKIPYPHRSIDLEDSANSLKLQLKSVEREELKRAVREVLSEIQPPIHSEKDQQA